MQRLTMWTPSKHARRRHQILGRPQRWVQRHRAVVSGVLGGGITSALVVAFSAFTSQDDLASRSAGLASQRLQEAQAAQEALQASHEGRALEARHKTLLAWLAGRRQTLEGLAELPALWPSDGLTHLRLSALHINAKDIRITAWTAGPDAWARIRQPSTHPVQQAAGRWLGAPELVELHASPGRPHVATSGAAFEVSVRVPWRVSAEPSPVAASSAS